MNPLSSFYHNTYQTPANPVPSVPSQTPRGLNKLRMFNGSPTQVGVGHNSRNSFEDEDDVKRYNSKYSDQHISTASPSGRSSLVDDALKEEEEAHYNQRRLQPILSSSPNNVFRDTSDITDFEVQLLLNLQKFKDTSLEESDDLVNISEQDFEGEEYDDEEDPTDNGDGRSDEVADASAPASDYYSDDDGSNSHKKRKRPNSMILVDNSLAKKNVMNNRTFTTTEEKMFLEAKYLQNATPTVSQIEEFSRKLGWPSKRVKQWFANKRSYAKRKLMYAN